MKKLFGRITLVSIAALLAMAGAGCGGDDDDSGNGACDAYKKKSTECGLNLECGSNPPAQAQCGFRCFTNASCSDITNEDPNTPFARCLAACSPDAAS